MERSSRGPQDCQNDTERLTVDPDFEADLFANNHQLSKAERKHEGKTSVGQVAIDGFYPVIDYGLGELGSIEKLTFFFVDTDTD